MIETKSGGYTPALITMKSTQLNVSKKWNSMMKTIQIADGKGGFAIPPMHGVVYNLASTLTKERQRFLVWLGCNAGQNFRTRR